MDRDLHCLSTSELWDFAPTETKLKTRAQLMFLKDSGLRVSDLVALNVGDYIEAETVGEDGGIFKVFWPKETEKTSDPAYIHIGPEAVEALESYLEERRARGKKCGAEQDASPGR